MLLEEIKDATDLTESKGPCTQRLRREKRWDAAIKFRISVKKEIQAAYKVTIKNRRLRKDETDIINDYSWSEMMRNFPPLPKEEKPKEEKFVRKKTETPETPKATPEEMETLLENLGDQPASPDMVRDIQWVYQYMQIDKVTAEDAPSPGAWGLLRSARNNPQDFYKNLLPKAMPSQKNIDERSKFEDDGREELKELDKLITKFEETFYKLEGE